MDVVSVPLLGWLACWETRGRGGWVMPAGRFAPCIQRALLHTERMGSERGARKDEPNIAVLETAGWQEGLQTKGHPDPDALRDRSCSRRLWIPAAFQINIAESMYLPHTLQRCEPAELPHVSQAGLEAASALQSSS